MSGRLKICLDDKREFIESILQPSFNPKYNLKTADERDCWMSHEARDTSWDEAVSTELIKRYGFITSLEDAQKELREVKKEQKEAEETTATVQQQGSCPPAQCVKFDNPVGTIDPKGIPCNSPNLINTDIAVNWIYDYLMANIESETDPSFRKSPILIARCPRGGKTTVLELLHVKLKEMTLNALSVSFNGNSGFKLQPSETPCEALFRVITNQLDATIPKDRPRVVEWNRLSAHIGDQPFVLLIDELNVLCPVVKADLATVLKDVFLDKANRHLVITSHQPFLTEWKDTTESAEPGVPVGQLWSGSVIALSDRALTVAPMPVCNDVVRLRAMSALHCSSLTHSSAAYYGYMPSLMYAVCRLSEESPSAKFIRVVPGTSQNMEQFHDFVVAVLTGIPHPSLHQFYCFASGVQIHTSLGVRIKWPLCYIACIVRYFAGSEPIDDIAKCIEVLADKCDTVGDGMVWEQCVRIALLFKIVLAAGRRNWVPPLELCGKEEAYGADVKVLHLGPSVKSVQDTKIAINEQSTYFLRNTLVLFVPTEASLNQFDGFCVRFQNCAVQQVAGYQCKDNGKGAKGSVPAWINSGGHLLRSDAPQKCKAGGRMKDGWTYYNAEDTDTFLGWSLQIMR